MVDILMNRAVHVARRDAHYRCSLELLEGRFGDASLAKRRDRVARMLAHLEEASYEATCALRGTRGWRAEKMFLKYLHLICDAARAAQVMVQHEALLKEDKGFLKQFLRGGEAKIAQFEERARSMAGEIIEAVAELVLYASATYSDLKKANLDSLSPNDKTRYRIAHDAVIPRMQ
ncbi:MAG: hypothetical protein NT045_07105 [Candidatus Aureabacteria bacterium]|nr:hypothetical protein [Candidatus Auribacterota bacterium]